MNLQAANKNLLKIPADAVVNPANVSLRHGGGLCGVIHKAAGQELEQFCLTLPKQSIGDAAITPAFNLPNCLFVIHACGPRWLDGSFGEAEALIKTYENTMALAIEHKLNHIVIPAISTGIYRFPFEEAAQIAVSVVSQYVKDTNIQVTFVNLEKPHHEFYKSLIKSLE